MKTILKTQIGLIIGLFIGGYLFNNSIKEIIVLFLIVNIGYIIGKLQTTKN